MITSIPNRLQFIETINLRGEAVDVLVSFDVTNEGCPRVHGKCERLDNGEMLPIANWQRKFKKDAAAVVGRVTQNLYNLWNQTEGQA